MSTITIEKNKSENRRYDHTEKCFPLRLITSPGPVGPTGPVGKTGPSPIPPNQRSTFGLSLQSSLQTGSSILVVGGDLHNPSDAETNSSLVGINTVINGNQNLIIPTGSGGITLPTGVKFTPLGTTNTAIVTNFSFTIKVISNTISSGSLVVTVFAGNNNLFNPLHGYGSPNRPIDDVVLYEIPVSELPSAGSSMTYTLTSFPNDPDKNFDTLYASTLGLSLLLDLEINNVAIGEAGNTCDVMITCTLGGISS